MAKHRGSKLYNADREVRAKTDSAIERETAEKWAARAAACWRRYQETGRQGWLVRAVEYRHEAIEHAASVSGKYVDVIKHRLNW